MGIQFSIDFFTVVNCHFLYLLSIEGTKKSLSFTSYQKSSPKIYPFFFFLAERMCNPTKEQNHAFWTKKEKKLKDYSSEYFFNVSARTLSKIWILKSWNLKDLIFMFFLIFISSLSVFGDNLFLPKWFHVATRLW